MCEPVSLAVASFAIGAVQSAAGYVSASSQAEAQNAMYEQNKLNAQQAYADTTKAISHRQAQEQEAAATQKFDTAIEGRKAVATNRVAAGEMGISGNTVEGLIRDMYGQGDRASDRIDQNTDWTMTQLQDQKSAAGYQMVDRINSVQKAQKPNFLDTGLKIAATGLNAAASYKTNLKNFG